MIHAMLDIQRLYILIYPYRQATITHLVYACKACRSDISLRTAEAAQPTVAVLGFFVPYLLRLVVLFATPP